MGFSVSKVRRGILGAVLILLPVIFLMVSEMSSAILWTFYPASDQQVTNLTKDGHLWHVEYYNDTDLVEQAELVLPHNAFGKVPRSVTRIVLSTKVASPLPSQQDLALHTGRVFARSYKVFVNDIERYSEADLGFDTNVPLPAMDEIHVKYDLDVGGVAEPGFDIRSQILIGSRIKLSRISNLIQEKDHSVVLWLVIPRLIIGVLFALGSLIFAYGIEYRLFGLFSLLSGLKTASTYGELNLYFPEVLDHSTLLNSLNFASMAVFLIFLHAFFRRHSPWVRRVAYALATAAVANVALTRMWSIGADIFVYVYYAGNIIQQAICIYGAVIGWQTYSYLRRTKRSFPRQMISLIVAITCVTAVPVLSYVMTASDIFWLGGPIFELCFILIVASCVSTDIGGVRAERDVIRRKLGMFVDEGKVNDIIKSRGSSKEWRENISVMFIDIRSFCLMNEVFGPHAIFDAVTDYYQEVIQTVYEYGGIVDKFIGDGVLAVWGIENSTVDRPEKQCIRAALALRKRLRELNQSRLDQGKFQFSVGIGIHSGRVTYGLIGTDERAEFTIIGSTVNIAARIEKGTKTARSDILISNSSYQLLKDDLIVCPRGSTHVVEELSGTEVFQPLALIDGGKLLINDPVYEAMNLEPVAGIINNAPPNLMTYNYAEFIGQPPGMPRKATG